MLRPLIGASVVVLAATACGGGSGTGSVPSASTSAAPKLSPTQAKASFKAPAPGSDPCLLLDAEVAKRELGAPTVALYTQSRPSPQLQRCAYEAGKSAFIALSIYRGPQNLAIFESENPTGQGDRPAGAGACVGVPGVGDAAVYCPAYNIQNSSGGGFLAVLAGSTRLNAVVEFSDANGATIEPKSKDKTIEFIRLVLAP